MATASPVAVKMPFFVDAFLSNGIGSKKLTCSQLLNLPLKFTKVVRPQTRCPLLKKGSPRTKTRTATKLETSQDNQNLRHKYLNRTKGLPPHRPSWIELARNKQPRPQAQEEEQNLGVVCKVQTFSPNSFHSQRNSPKQPRQKQPSPRTRSITRPRMAGP